MMYEVIPDGTSYCCPRNDQSVAIREDVYRSRHVWREHRVVNPFATIRGGWGLEGSLVLFRRELIVVDHYFVYVGIDER